MRRSSEDICCNDECVIWEKLCVAVHGSHICCCMVSSELVHISNFGLHRFMSVYASMRVLMFLYNYIYF